MSKRKKKSPLRNDFTDALQVEMDERKIVERTQPKEEIFQKAVTLEKVSVEVEEIKLVEKVKPVEEIKIEIPPTVEVKAETKLEERILKEADNTFFDEKPAEVKKPNNLAEKPKKSSIYHSKALRKWEEEQLEEKETPPPISAPPKVNAPHKMSHSEKFGVVAAVAMLVYAFVNFDKPLFFLALSLFVHFLSLPVGSMFGKHSAAVQNALRTFSIVVFFGAVMFLFF